MILPTVKRNWLTSCKCHMRKKQHLATNQKYTIWNKVVLKIATIIL